MILDQLKRSFNHHVLAPVRGNRARFAPVLSQITRRSGLNVYIHDNSGTRSPQALS